MFLRRFAPLALVAYLLTSGGAARAADAEAIDFIQTLGDEFVSVLADKELPAERRLEEFRRLFIEGFDVRTISRFALGRYWRRASKNQRQEYGRLFSDYIVNTYSDRLGQYSGEKIVVGKTRNDAKRDRIVSSKIVRPKGKPVRLDWRLRQRDQGFKIVDVVIEGVSMAITQRDAFSSVIRRGGGKVESLLEELRSKVRGKQKKSERRRPMKKATG
ncbi:MAG: ABC transporter substrate-binding protein [Alphaproteobacteria bacterium]|jgi:phospholipid transport system substrate-binding protein|nr:toluene tolerance protein [Rhodospirillaceae bacterium]MDP6405880.1 ABC transporter substrate-binding protein [Alphaproteobacteria bacterium]MDP6624588.1 ABC transporter substrate-binding protein [Alphaproteobacteria bacterium]|tara:strand:+ start:118 stop:765 length:648 start_codon:yes stop_codon:yes gene_type:complete